MERRFRRDSIIIDAGIIYALSDKTDSWHNKCIDFIKSFKGKLIIPSSVIPEACYLLNKFLGSLAEEKFIDSLANREITIEHFNINDLSRCVELLKKYRDLNIGFVDASVIAIAERLKIDKILTTDRKHFSAIKPVHCEAFTLLP